MASSRSTRRGRGRLAVRGAVGPVGKLGEMAGGARSKSKGWNLEFVAVKDPEVQLLGCCRVVIDCGGEAVAAELLGGHRLEGQNERKNLSLPVLETLCALHFERPHGHSRGILAWIGDANFDLVRPADLLLGTADQGREIDRKRSRELGAPKARNACSEDIQKPFAHRRGITNERRDDLHSTQVTRLREAPS